MDMLPSRRELLASLGTAAAAQLVDHDSNVPEAKGLVERYRIETFGARGDGVTDDTAAFERALAKTPAGGRIELGEGRSYRLARSLVITKPLAIVGGIKEKTRLLFGDGRYATLGGLAAAVILPHEKGRGMSSGQTARRSSLSGFTVSWVGEQGTALHGLLISAPVYLNEIDVMSFPGDGFRIEAESEAIGGNANGSSFMNCSAIGNSGNGFSFYGNDANACLLLGSRAFENRLCGFYDASLLGNTYVAGEVDGNLKAGFSSTRSGPNRSVFIGCYSEPNQIYDLNHRNLVLGALGHMPGNSAACIRALPSGELFGGTGQVFAENEAVAAALVDAAGRYVRIGMDGLDLRSADGQRIRFTKLLSPNYVDLLNGEHPLIRLPMGAVAGNVTEQRPWLPSGFAVGGNGRSGILGAGPRPPASGTFDVGALWLNDTPRPGQFVGWVCVSHGQPGQWLPFGRIENGS